MPLPQPGHALRISQVRLKYVSTLRTVVVSDGEVAHFGGDDGVSERPLPLASSRGLPRWARSASLRAAGGRACVGSRRERSAPFDFPPEEDWSADYHLIKHDGRAAGAHGSGESKRILISPD